jgi:hypothetical protein
MIEAFDLAALTMICLPLLQQLWLWEFSSMKRIETHSFLAGQVDAG